MENAVVLRIVTHIAATSGIAVAINQDTHASCFDSNWTFEDSSIYVVILII